MSKLRSFMDLSYLSVFLKCYNFYLNMKIMFFIREIFLNCSPVIFGQKELVLKLVFECGLLSPSCQQIRGNRKVL